MPGASGPVIGLQLVDDHVATYCADSRDADVRIVAFMDAPRVSPALAHGSNAWRQFKLGVAAHRTTNGVSDLARYTGQCARAATSRVFRAGGTDGSEVHVKRVEGLLRLIGDDDVHPANQQPRRSPSRSAQSSRSPSAQPLASAADVSHGNRSTSADSSTAQQRQQHVRRADRDMRRIEERLQAIDALRRSLDRSGDDEDGGSDESDGGDRYGEPSRDVSTSRGASSAVYRRSHQHRSPSATPPHDSLSDTQRPSPGQVTRATFQPSASRGGSSARTSQGARAASAAEAPERRSGGTRAVPALELPGQRPVPVNRDDAEDEEIAVALAALGDQLGSMTPAERRSYDALRKANAILDDRTRETRLSIAAVLAEAVALKRTHQHVEAVCQSHPRSALARDVRAVLRGGAGYSVEQSTA